MSAVSNILIRNRKQLFSSASWKNLLAVWGSDKKVCQWHPILMHTVRSKYYLIYFGLFLCSWFIYGFTHRQEPIAVTEVKFHCCKLESCAERLSKKVWHKKDPVANKTETLWSFRVNIEDLSQRLSLGETF